MKFPFSKKNGNNTDVVSDREIILEKLYRAVGDKESCYESITGSAQFRTPVGSLAEVFKEMAEAVKAQVFIVEDGFELAGKISALIAEMGWNSILCAEDQIRNMLTNKGITILCSESLTPETEVVISGCEYLVSSLGSVVVSSGQAHSRRMFVYPPVHIVVARASQLTETLEEAYEKTIARYGANLPSLITVITGPSRTADIEKTLVLGAHGPEKLIIFIVNQVL